MSLNPLTIAPVFPLWLILLLLILGLAGIALQHRTTREKLGTRKAWIISLLRTGVMALIVACALNPSVIFRKAHNLLPSVAVLVDLSPGMGQPAGPQKGTRLEEAMAILTQGPHPLLRSLKERFRVSVYGLSDSARPLGDNEPVRLEPADHQANAGRILAGLNGKSSLAVLFSDGNMAWEGGSARQVPAITVPLGNRQEYRDILIKEVKAPALAFRKREVAIEVTIKSYGYKGLSLPVLLEESGKLITAKNIPIQTTPAEVTVSLSFVPDEVGQKNISISVPQQVGENILENNQILIPMKIMRDKTRILMVSGRPSMNYRFMRSALKSDPSIDLLSFVILRTFSDILNAPTHELSLTPFPAETLFTRELTRFDLVIFDNFDYTVYLRPEYLESLRNFVKEGGGFAVIGGPNLFDEGKKGISPIGDILPFRFLEEKFYRRDPPIGVRVTLKGAGHPLMQIFDDFPEDDAGPDRFWKEMPPVDGINLMDVKKTSTVLMESAEAIPWPVLAVGDYGKGRTLALATDYAWKWYMGRVADGKGTQPYLRLMHRMVRWLTKDPGLDPVQIIMPETAAAAGREMEVRVRFRKDDPSGASDAAVSFSVFNPEGIRIASQLKSSPGSGEHIVSFLPEKSGVYQLKVETPQGLTVASTVVAGPLDRLDGAPDHDRLQRIAETTGGQYVSENDDLLKVIEKHARKGSNHFVEQTRKPLWASPVVMAVLLGLLSAEWYFRRRWGLI
ncbi:MAG: glutamine amidotransferase [Desulfobacterales bacterium]|nr:glutamine amidotransferase [Desulfobacterales bacterium]